MKKFGVVLAVCVFTWVIFYGSSDTRRPLADKPVRPLEDKSVARTSHHNPVPWQETYAWGQLQDLFNTCRVYWNMPESDGDCTLEGEESPFLFREDPVDRSPDEGWVELILISGERYSFEATARHEKSKIVWSIDADGKTTCSPGSANACWNASHSSQKETMQEVHHVFGDDVPDDARSIEFKGTMEEPYVEFERGRK